jgi:AcrR family transcriptional regulator
MKTEVTSGKRPRVAGRPRSQAARQQILEAAYKLLRSKGMQSVSTQEIAAKAGVSTATLYRWWDTKEAIMLDAMMEHARPALAPEGKGSPLEELRADVLRQAKYLASEDGKVVSRLLAGIHENEDLREQFRQRVIFPRRVTPYKLVDQAIKRGELPKDTDPVVLLDTLYGPTLHRLFLGHAPITPEFAGKVADLVLGGRRAGGTRRRSRRKHQGRGSL